MTYIHPKSPRPNQEELHQDRTIDYSPKTYSFREQFTSALKLLAIVGAIGLLLWFVNAMTS